MDLSVARRRMVEEQIEKRGIRDPEVLAAMREVPRHLFVGEALRDRAYGDHPLPVGGGQTISQPYIVALMTEELRVLPEHTVLEIGTGSGYQAAVLARLAQRVLTVERMPELARRARANLDLLGVKNVATRLGDGTWGWREQAPFPRIMITAAAPSVPRPLINQLVEGGILVAPVGTPDYQMLRRFTRRGEELETEDICPCTFVPLLGTGRGMDEEEGSPN